MFHRFSKPSWFVMKEVDYHEHKAKSQNQNLLSTFKSSSRVNVELGSMSSPGLMYSCSLLNDSQTRTTERP